MKIFTNSQCFFWHFPISSCTFYQHFSISAISFSISVKFRQILMNNLQKNSQFHQKKRNEKKWNEMKWNEMKWNLFIPPKIWTIFCWNFEIWAAQRIVNLVDLKNPEKMRLLSLSELSIQKRTSLLKFGGQNFIISIDSLVVVGVNNFWRTLVECSFSAGSLQPWASYKPLCLFLTTTEM